MRFCANTVQSRWHFFLALSVTSREVCCLPGTPQQSAMCPRVTPCWRWAGAASPLLRGREGASEGSGSQGGTVAGVYGGGSLPLVLFYLS